MLLHVMLCTCTTSIYIDLSRCKAQVQSDFRGWLSTPYDGVHWQQTESRNTKGVIYFEANLSDSKRCARVVSFDTAHRVVMKKAEECQISCASIKRHRNVISVQAVPWGCSVPIGQNHQDCRHSDLDRQSGDRGEVQGGEGQ